MATATLTSKGQLTLPKEVRDRLQLHPGDRVDFVLTESGQTEVRPLRRRLEELFGVLGRVPGSPPTRAELRQDVINQVAEDHERILRGER